MADDFGNRWRAVLQLAEEYGRWGVEWFESDTYGSPPVLELMNRPLTPSPFMEAASSLAKLCEWPGDRFAMIALAASAQVTYLYRRAPRRKNDRKVFAFPALLVHSRALAGYQYRYPEAAGVAEEYLERRPVGRSSQGRRRIMAASAGKADEALVNAAAPLGAPAAWTAEKRRYRSADGYSQQAIGIGIESAAIALWLAEYLLERFKIDGGGIEAISDGLAALAEKPGTMESRVLRMGHPFAVSDRLAVAGDVLAERGYYADPANLFAQAVELFG